MLHVVVGAIVLLLLLWLLLLLLLLVSLQFAHTLFIPFTPRIVVAFVVDALNMRFAYCSPFSSLLLLLLLADNNNYVVAAV